MDTYEPIMVTIKKETISSVLFGKTRRAVLGLLFGRPDESFYLRQIARIAGVGLGAVQRELRRLSDTGIITKVRRGREVYYQANRDCPIFGELLVLMTKTAGLADVLRARLPRPVNPRSQNDRGIYGKLLIWLGKCNRRITNISRAWVLCQKESC